MQRLTSDEKNCNQNYNEGNTDSTYKYRKQLSVKVFKYIVEANNEQLENMKLDISGEVQNDWQ